MRGFEPHHSPHFFLPKNRDSGWNRHRFLDMGVSPSGKATDFDSVIGGPTPPTPASHQILQTALCRIFCVARRTAYLLLLIAYRYPLSASQSFCIGRAIKGRSFYVQIKDQLRPTWRSYAGPPQQRRISVQAVREALIKSLLDFILVFLFNARNQLTRIASCLRRLMKQHWIKIHMKSDSANESVLPYASLADKSRSALFYNAPVRASSKPSEPSGRQAGPS